MTLYSYCIPVDDGAAPNPFWGICTLAICKPVIRRSAKVGDWIVATGSMQFGLENQVVYAMEVTGVKTFEEYDAFCKRQLLNKIPDWTNKDIKRHVGDCIYDYSNPLQPVLRESVHTEANRKRDLGGRNVLLSEHFYYFGSDPVPLHSSLLNIVRQGQGHRSVSNDPYKEAFVDWIEGFSELRNKVTALPYGLKDISDISCRTRCSKLHLELDEKDEELELTES